MTDPRELDPDNPNDVDRLARTIYAFPEDWDDLHPDDKEFAIESAYAVLDVFRVTTRRVPGDD